MSVEVHIIAWNEADIIPLTIKHYQKFCDKIVVHDNFSSDGTDLIAKDLGCEVRTFGRDGELSDKEYLKIKNQVWKSSTADWVILVDADEILYYPFIKNVLEQAKQEGKTIFKTQGWQVFSNDFPKYDLLEIKTGFIDENYSKAVIFNPRALQSINYTYGCHTCHPIGNIQYANQVLTLFHYRNIGGVERLVNRHAQYRKRLSPLNREMGLGIHYTYADERRRQEWSEQLAKSKEYSQDGL